MTDGIKTARNELKGEGLDEVEAVIETRKTDNIIDLIKRIVRKEKKFEEKKDLDETDTDIDVNKAEKLILTETQNEKVDNFENFVMSLYIWRLITI